MSFIATNVLQVEERIQKACDWARRDRESVTLIAAGKYASIDEVIEAKKAGITYVGENYVQDAQEKLAAVGYQLPGITWHMIGHLQRNKVKEAIKIFSMIHSIDSFRLADEISKQAVKAQNQIDLLVEVNIAREETKFGLSPEDAKQLSKQIVHMPGCRLQGLMCMVPFSDDSENSRIHYRQLRELRDELAGDLGIVLPHLSMGMTQDFEIAIEEGATMIRVGRAIFRDA